MQVSSSSITYCYQWCSCLYLWLLFWENTFDQAISEENMGGFHWSIGSNHDLSICGEQANSSCINWWAFFLSCWGHLTLHLVRELLAAYIAGTSFERCNFLLFVVCVLCTKTKFLRFYQCVMALSLYLAKRDFDCVSLMTLPPSCMQLANILGRFQWLTCPRKVSF